MDEQIPKTQDANSGGGTSQTPPSTPNVDTPKPETARNRYLVAAILILVVIGLGSWIWHNQAPNLFPTPTSTPTPISNQQLASSSTVPISDDISNWQTYRNEEYGFEFKYPGEFMQMIEPQADVNPSWIVSFSTPAPDPTSIVISILTAVRDNTADSGWIDGSRTIRYEDQSIEIQLNFKTPLFDTQVGDQILSTFKFIE